MNVGELLMELRSRGVLLEPAGDRLKIDAPRGSITPELREALAACKSEVLAILTLDDDEIAWRVKVMLPQIPDSGPIPFLVARQTEERRSNCCHSCGDSMEGYSGYLCGPCSRATNQAIEIAMRNFSPNNWGFEKGVAQLYGFGASKRKTLLLLETA